MTSHVDKKTVLMLLPKEHIRTIGTGAFFIFAICALLLFSFSSGYAANTAISVNTPEARSDAFKQAVTDDLSGHPEDARQYYDALANTDMADAIAVPSAVNLAALGQFKEAQTAFNTLAKSTHSRDRDYAHLWQLWLTARLSNNPSATPNKSLKKMAKGLKASARYQQEIINLYAGQGSVSAVFEAVSAIPEKGEIQRKDAFTEATFFASGYLQYVKHSNHDAKTLVEENLSQLNNLSLERPLITREMATL